MATQRQLIGNVRGAQGEPGQPVRIIAQTYAYQTSENGKTPPTGLWLPNVSDTTQGSYLWTRNTITYDNGDDSIIYTVAYQGKDGAYAGESDVAGIKSRVQQLEDRITPVEKGGTGSTTIEGVKAKLGIDDIESKIEDTHSAGVNLVRATKDFIDGQTPTGTPKVYIDGWTAHQTLSNAEITKSVDTDGFTELKINHKTSGTTAINSAKVPVDSKDKIYTLCLEVKPGDDYVPLSTYGTSLGTLVTLKKGSGSENTYYDIYERSPKTQGTVTKGKWSRIQYSFSLNEFTATASGSKETPLDELEFVFRCTNRGTGALSYKKVLIYEGDINNPTWSPSPFDIDRINDYTTGINLLRGTRDWIHGTTRPKNNSAVYVDGFSVTESGYISVLTGADGFKYLKVDSTSASSAFSTYAPAATGIKKGDVYTLSFNIRFDSQVIPTDIFGVSVYRGSSSVDGFVYPSLKTLLPEDVQTGVWYNVKYTFTIKVDTTDDDFVAIPFRIQPGLKLSLRMVCLNPGNINHPIWSESPFDIVPMESGGTGDTHGIPAKTELVAGNDLNKIIEGGWYYCNSGSAAGNISNCPEASVFAMQVFRSAPKEDTASGQIFQVIYFNNAKTMYVRRAAYPGTTWNDWVEIYGSGRQIPITNGGTGAKDAAGARQNLGITPLIEALQARVQTLEEQVQLLM